MNVKGAEKIKGGWLVLRVDDEVIRDANFPDGIAASKLAESERMLYNLTNGFFGYGSDGYDWENDGDEWIEIEQMDEGEKGQLILYFTAGYFPCSWTWQDGTVEGVVAKVKDGRIIEVYSLSDQEWKDAGDLDEVPENTIIYASFREALEEVSEI